MKNTASRIQLNHWFSVNHYLSFRIKQGLLIVYSYKFICVCLYCFILLKLKHALFTAGLLNQIPTKKVMLL